MTLMRFDPFRELDRLGERLLSGAPLRAMPTEAFRRGDAARRRQTCRRGRTHA